MMSWEEEYLRRRYGAWRYWRWLGLLRGVLLWARVRWMAARGSGGTVVRLGPGLYIWPYWPWRRRKYENLTIGAGGPVSQLRAMLRREHAILTRPVTCPFWRWALSGGVMAAAGNLLDRSWVSALIAVIIAYLLVNWEFVRGAGGGR